MAAVGKDYMHFTVLQASFFFYVNIQKTPVVDVYVIITYFLLGGYTITHTIFIFTRTLLLVHCPESLN